MSPDLVHVQSSVIQESVSGYQLMNDKQDCVHNTFHSYYLNVL